MFEIPANDQWRTLFAVAEKFIEHALWEKIPEEFIIELCTGESEDPIYATIHGFEEEIFGISVYADKSDVQKYMNIISEGDDISFQTIVANQSCVSAIFGEPFHLGPGDVTAMEQGGYTPKEIPCSHIYFRSYQPGFSPWYISGPNAELLIKGLTALDKAIPLFPAEIPDTSAFMLRCTVGENTAAEVVPFDESLMEDAKEPVVKDDFYVARLKRLKKTAKCIEVELCYLSNPVSSQLGAIPFFPQMCIIANVDEGYIADQCLFDETTEEEEAFFTFLANYFQQSGLPRKINIRTSTTAYLMRDLCKRLHITLDESDDLPMIDDFLNMIGGITPGE